MIYEKLINDTMPYDGRRDDYHRIFLRRLREKILYIFARHTSSPAEFARKNRTAALLEFYQSVSGPRIVRKIGRKIRQLPGYFPSIKNLIF